MRKGPGISGHKSNQMLARLERDVLAKNPDWMTLSCGVNDVWHGAKGVPLDEYKKNITKIVDQCQAKGVKVMILTSTMIGEDASATLGQSGAGVREQSGCGVSPQCPVRPLACPMILESHRSPNAGYLGQGFTTVS